MKRSSKDSCILASIWIALLSLSAWSWEADRRLTQTQYYAAEPAIAVNGNLVAAVWEDYRDGNDEVYCKTSADSGATWSADMRVSTSDSVSWLPDVAVSDNGIVHVVFQDDRLGTMAVFYTKYQNSSWSMPAKVNDGNSYAAYPAICTHQNNVYMAWEDFRDNNDEIYFRMIHSSGTVGPDIRVTDNGATSWGADIAVDANGAIHLAWFDYRTGNDDIFYANSPDNGATWATPSNVSNDAKNSWDPQIAIGTNNAVHLVWYSFVDAQNAYEVSYSRRVSTSWQARTFLSTGGNDSKLPSVGTMGDRVLVAWEDYRDSNDEIYFVYSADNGDSWGPETRLTHNFRDSFGSSVAMGPTWAMVSWFDYRDAVDQVYFNRSHFGDISSVSVKEPLTKPLGISKFGARFDSFHLILSGITPSHFPLQVVDVQGRQMVRRARMPSSLPFARLPVHPLASGTYFVVPSVGAPLRIHCSAR